jgi:HK97 family phage prohead protease
MSKKMNREIDIAVSGLCVREAEGEGRSRTIEGHAVVFGVRSVNLVPRSSFREVYEVMERGCISTDLLNRSDVVLTAFHDNTAILGRWRQGKGTLKLTLDVRGLKMECTLAETARADELLSAIERGDISGMSFAFTADEDDSENGVSYEKLAERSADGKDVWIRHVKRVSALYDVTIAGHPAYPQTDIAQREAEAFFDEKLGTKEVATRAAEAAAKAAEAAAQAAEEAAKAQEARERTMAAERRRRMRRKLNENTVY